MHTVAERCGYHLENHHHALADAEACAQIALLIIPEPKKERKTKKADKDIHVGDLFASLIPQPVKKSKWKTLQLLFQSIIAVVFDNKVLTMYFD